MGKRLLILTAMVAAIALLIAGVAAAAGGLAPSDDVSLHPSSSLPPDTQAGDEVTAESTESTESADPSTYTTADLEDTDTTDEVTTEPTVHPDNFGGTISSLRHAGDHTPAAVLKGKKVPGFYKKTTTTATEPTTTSEAPPQG